MATVSENLQTIVDCKIAIKQAINDKGGQVGNDLTTYAAAIASLPSGGGDVNPTASKNDVTFYDYDGSILYSYTAEEFLALTEMPPLPTQKGLICQEWNWSFEDAMEYVAEYGILDVGATYITDDGKTRLYIRIAAEGRMDVPLYFQQTKANGVVIDWGDGSAAQTLNGTGNVNTTHRYASIGDYIISLDVDDECTLKLGHDTATQSVMGGVETSNSAYRTMLHRVEIGKNVALNAAFRECYALTNISIPNNTSLIGDYCFYFCYSLHSIVLPSAINEIKTQLLRDCYALHLISMPANVKRIGSSAIYVCRSLRSIVLPAQLTYIDAYSIDSNRSLASIIIPASVTNISLSAMGYNYSMAYYDFSHHTAVPTLVNTNAFAGIPSDCKIIVPDALYDKWIAATNWSTYASYIIKKTDWDNR